MSSLAEEYYDFVDWDTFDDDLNELRRQEKLDSIWE